MITSSLLTGLVATWAATHVSSLLLTHASRSVFSWWRHSGEAKRKRQEELSQQALLRWLEANKQATTVPASPPVAAPAKPAQAPAPKR